MNSMHCTVYTSVMWHKPQDDILLFHLIASLPAARLYMLYLMVIAFPVLYRNTVHSFNVFNRGGDNPILTMPVCYILGRNEHKWRHFKRIAMQYNEIYAWAWTLFNHIIVFNNHLLIIIDYELHYVIESLWWSKKKLTQIITLVVDQPFDQFQ